MNSCEPRAAGGGAHNGPPERHEYARRPRAPIAAAAAAAAVRIDCRGEGALLCPQTQLRDCVNRQAAQTMSRARHKHENRKGTRRV